MSAPAPAATMFAQKKLVDAYKKGKGWRPARVLEALPDKYHIAFTGDPRKVFLPHKHVRARKRAPEKKPAEIVIDLTAVDDDDGSKDTEVDSLANGFANNMQIEEEENENKDPYANMPLTPAEYVGGGYPDPVQGHGHHGQGRYDDRGDYGREGYQGGHHHHHHHHHLHLHHQGGQSHSDYPAHSRYNPYNHTDDALRAHQHERAQRERDERRQQQRDMYGERYHNPYPVDPEWLRRRSEAAETPKPTTPGPIARPSEHVERAQRALGVGAALASMSIPRKPGPVYKHKERKEWHKEREEWHKERKERRKTHMTLGGGSPHRRRAPTPAPEAMRGETESDSEAEAVVTLADMRKAMKGKRPHASRDAPPVKKAGGMAAGYKKKPLGRKPLAGRETEKEKERPVRRKERVRRARRSVNVPLAEKPKEPVPLSHQATRGSGRRKRAPARDAGLPRIALLRASDMRAASQLAAWTASLSAASKTGAFTPLPPASTTASCTCCDSSPPPSETGGVRCSLCGGGVHAWCAAIGRRDAAALAGGGAKLVCVPCVEAAAGGGMPRGRKFPTGRWLQVPRMVSPVVEVLRVWRMSTMALAVRRTAERGGRVRRTGVVRLDEETQREMARNVDRLREGARPRSVVQSNITRLLHYD